MEKWKAVEGMPGYEVSSHGRMRSYKFCRRSPNDVLPRILSCYSLPTGYQMIDLKDKGSRTKAYVHALVLEAFVGCRPDGMQVAHLDGDPSNNMLSNLVYATPVENASHKVGHGTFVEGQRHYRSKLTNAQAAELFMSPLSISEAAERFGVSYHVAYHVRRRNTYKSATSGMVRLGASD
jgi:hypothetical protein